MSLPTNQGAMTVAALALALGVQLPGSRTRARDLRTVDDAAERLTAAEEKRARRAAKRARASA